MICNRPSNSFYQTIGHSTSHSYMKGYNAIHDEAFDEETFI